MAVSAADVIPPMFATSEVVMFFLAGMTGQASFGNLLGRFVLEGDYLRRISFRNVRQAGTVTRLTPGDLAFPAS